MGIRRCCVPGCSSVLKKNEKYQKHLSFFRPPSNNDTLEKWRQAVAVPYPGFQFTKNGRICELHFCENDINKFLTIKLKDGTYDKIERERITLKFGAIPTIFPSDVVDRSTKSKSPLTTTVEEGSEKANSEPHTCTDFDEDIPDIEAFSYKILLEEVRFIVVPGELWGLTATSQFMICSKYAKNYNLERKIVIENDLNVRIFLMEREVHVNGLTKISCIDDVSTILREVENLGICAGASDKLMVNCSIYLPIPAIGKPGPTKTWCKECVVLRKKTNFDRKRTEQIVPGFQPLKQQLKNMRSKLYRQQIKINELHKKLMKSKNVCTMAKADVLEEADSILQLP